MCSKSHLCVDQLLEQELCEDCLLLRLSQWFGSPCGCSRRALVPRKKSWEHGVLCFGVCGVSPSWKAPAMEPHSSARRLRSSPRGGEAAFPPENGREQNPGFSLVLALPPCKGRAQVTQEELLVCSCPSSTCSLCSLSPS